MLSYQHLYHAGNPADVHKHAILAWMLGRLTEKPKPLTYVETHAGRGLYDLSSAEAVKTGEAKAGVGRLLSKFDPAHPYSAVIEAVRTAHGAASYPGSPAIAGQLLRDADRIHLAELHPQEHAALRKAMEGRGRVHRADGFELAMSLCPPDPRRGLVLIDPSYEIKADYERLPRFIRQVNRVWNVGVIVLWYPVLREAVHLEMLTALQLAGLPGTFRHEVRFPPVRPGHRMIGSGLFVVNAPYGLKEAADEVAALFAG
ncbi:hypothetical protein OB2597_07255 [Pseudooceanicola batsensis HTCC2597]|uniref:Ribosomal RNA large subunit methyltransferase J n=1 Tax=Pseudooceanicola batsensis (strain ATCC BAA-863 / DSM 15984 / KCTC 12145 / HTCC2597) TaxID=252305 RepID=A3TTT6_PSEBH|nr:23S rRNA (adenine(2030)-N(6))-methyltransferase RlmJ [Pseudooceanicola batsensis]EAQ05063.1 hypothetical protein OB2597_07255 [Pseudooceanicola batsensis HTCC2597]